MLMDEMALFFSMDDIDMNRQLDWRRLLAEFEAFDLEPGDSMNGMDAELFAGSLIHPRPAFLERFLEIARRRNVPEPDAFRLLYGFLLKKRYQERLNLLHFAFNIFDDECRLPQDVIDRTPFPHEDGLPPFRHFGDPDFEI